MKKMTKETIKQTQTTATKKESKEDAKNRGQAQCCAKVSKIVAGCHD